MQQIPKEDRDKLLQKIKERQAAKEAEAAAKITEAANGTMDAEEKKGDENGTMDGKDETVDNDDGVMDDVVATDTNGAGKTEGRKRSRNGKNKK